MGMSAHQRIRRLMEEKKKAQAQQSGYETAGVGQTPDFEKMTIHELKEYARNSGIAIAGLTKKEDIRARIVEAISVKNSVDDSAPTAEETPVGVLPSDDEPNSGEAASVGEGAGGHGTDGGTA